MHSDLPVSAKECGGWGGQLKSTYKDHRLGSQALQRLTPNNGLLEHFPFTPTATSTEIFYNKEELHLKEQGGSDSN